MKKIIFTALFLSSFAAYADINCTVTHSKGSLFNKKIISTTKIDGVVKNLAVAQITTEHGSDYEYKISAEASCKNETCALNGLMQEMTTFEVDGQSITSSEAQVLVHFKLNESGTMRLRDNSSLKISCKE